MITVYGITNCSTVKKARNWLEENEIEYNFWDFKKQGVTKEFLQKWCNRHGWEIVLNRKGMMWRKSSEEVKNKVVDEKTAIEFMIDVPNSIKRPIVEYDDGVLIGFDEDLYKEKII